MKRRVAAHHHLKTKKRCLKAINLQGYLWSVLIIPGAVVALLGSFQVDVNELLALPEMSME